MARTLKVIGALLLAFGITFLDTNDWSFQVNSKPYIILVLGVALLAISYFIPIKDNTKP